PPSEMHYRPVPTKTIVDMIRYNYTRYFDRFSNKDIFKLFVRRVSEQIAVQRLKIPEGYLFYARPNMYASSLVVDESGICN
ncbi:unnamed protein product, partial [Rotaria magnacalcarata]